MAHTARTALMWCPAVEGADVAADVAVGAAADVAGDVERNKGSKTNCDQRSTQAI